MSKFCGIYLFIFHCLHAVTEIMCVLAVSAPNFHLPVSGGALRGGVDDEYVSGT